MGCGESKKQHSGEATDRIQEREYTESFKTVMAITKNGNGTRLMELYRRWPVPPGEEKEIKLQDGSTRLSWPRSWAEVENEFLELHVICQANDGALSAAEVAAIKAETVDNAEKPHIDENCVTWPCIQQLFRDTWMAVYKTDWKPAEHAEGMDWHVLLRANNLMLKANGLRQKLEEIDRQAAIDFIWEVFAAWPNPEEEVSMVERLNRKKGEPVMKNTWPLKWEVEGDGKCVVQVLKSCGWDEFLIEALRYQLFDNQKMSKVYYKCTPDEVCWPDLQQAFRAAICEDKWTDEETVEWPPLGPKITLRLKIVYEKIVPTLCGEWRMYCKPDEGDAFSYGLVISEVDMEKMTFTGGARTEGKYVLEDGKISYNPKNGRTIVSYTEVWPNGQRDKLSAHVKSNAKFQCESADSYEQKATREDLNLPATLEERVGAGVKDGVKKYYLHDADAAAD